MHARIASLRIGIICSGHEAALRYDPATRWPWDELCASPYERVAVSPLSNGARDG